MFHKTKSGKTSVVGIAIATVCILVYLGALVSVIVRVSTSMNSYLLVAEQEFYDLADLASSAGVLSFMDETFIEIIQTALNETRTLEGVIISGPSGEYGFEKERGRAIHWVNNSPRFRNRFDFSRQSLFLPLRIQGLRNVNIQAVARALNYSDLVIILRKAMTLIAIALVISFITLLAESMQKRSAGDFSSQGRRSRPSGRPKTHPAAGGDYSQRGNIVKKENTEYRLTEELQQCAATGNDLTFIAIEYKPSADENFFIRFAADASRFFSSRDFVCEKSQNGITVICPGLSLDAGFLNAEEFHNRIISKYPAVFNTKTDLCMGISARTQRPVNAERLIFEAEEALERALMDPVSHIVAFKSDPDKYRAFMESRTAN